MLKYGQLDLRRIHGFTLIEILMVISVFSILMAMAAPGFQTISQDARQVTLYNKVANVMRFARSEAIKRSTSVSVCPRKSDSTCGSDWSDGLLVYSDAAANGTAGTLDAADTVLRVAPLTGGGPTISASAIVRPLTTTASQNNIRFGGRGQSSWSTGTFLMCDNRGDKHAKALIMTGAGIGRKAHATPASDGIVVDGHGKAVSCS